ncbi:ubiquinol-cytochrome C chaperone family protein [Bradyrhizobium prioriisuperbiae]|uniref:ubiquinol-cytochrome C chaperone family protein n=1 Tax=Bradyrhizobium prioriisuperbiae TaxID=2854389 RepID=UPI0028ED7655|nr:ubiquinol-cytochrome C chaperone family protein [Bradyrhizobium prioritasuperba]
MLWPFKRFLNPQTPSRGTIEAIYGMIVAQAREPVFYQALNVPDTVNGRFDMVVLHLWLVLRPLQAGGSGMMVSQALFDRFCSDMDANLREMGVGDLTVPKRMQKFGEAFYGRTAAYDKALATGREALADALARNILNSPDPSRAASLCNYVEETVARMATVERAALEVGQWQFTAPRVLA